MAIWNTFQSVIQLAIALNCAFATLAPFLGNASERDRLLADDYLRQLDHYEDRLDRVVDKTDKTRTLGQSIAEMQSKFSDIKDASNNVDQQISGFINGKIRIVCLLFAAASLVALFVSSYASQTAIINDYLHAYMYVQYAPFAFGVGRIMELAMKHLKTKRAIFDLITNMQQIEARMRSIKANRAAAEA